MSRLYDMLSTHRLHKHFTLTPEAILDLRWFHVFIPRFTGIRLIRHLDTTQVVPVDSCLTGGGAATPTEFYAIQYPPKLINRELPIVCLEMLNLLIATRLWAHTWKSQNILLYSDNAATVATLQAARAKHPFLRAAAREVWLLTATYDIHLSIRHRPGASQEMQTADALSRAHLHQHFQQTITQLLETGATRRDVPLWLLTDPSPYL